MGLGGADLGKSNPLLEKALAMTIRRSALTAILFSLLLPVLTAHAQTDACRRFLMQRDNLRQLYARGDGMAVRIPPVLNRFPDLTAAHVHELAARKLRAAGLYDPDADQWLQISLNIGVVQFAMILSLRRWTFDLGYGLPGESTVWALGGGGLHRESAGRVLTRVSQRMDEFIELYVGAQNACAM